MIRVLVLFLVAAGQMIGSDVVPKQTETNRGKLCQEVMVCERLFTRREYYFSITLDRNTNGPILIGSSSGGVNIVEDAATEPDATVKVHIEIQKGLTKDIAGQVVSGMVFEGACAERAANNLVKLYNLFHSSDSSLLEIIPMAEDVNGTVYCMDCKVLLDSNAEYRQQELFNLKDSRGKRAVDEDSEFTLWRPLKTSSSSSALRPQPATRKEITIKETEAWYETEIVKYIVWGVIGTALVALGLLALLALKEALKRQYPECADELSEVFETTYRQLGEKSTARAKAWSIVGAALKMASVVLGRKAGKDDAHFDVLRDLPSLPV